MDHVEDTPSSPETAHPGVVHNVENSQEEEVPVTSSAEEVEVAAVSSAEAEVAAGDDDDDDDDVAVPSDDVTVSSEDVTVSSDDVGVSSSQEIATDEVMVQSLEEGVVVAAVSMESSFEDLSAKEEEEEAPIEVEAAAGSDDGFVHVEMSATQKDEAMKALSSLIKTEEDQANNTDGDWVALSSPALKVHALEESTTTPPISDSSTAAAAATSSVLDVAPQASRIISYHDVKTTAINPAQDVDPTKRESYLSDAEFETLFGMTKTEFYALPKWKQSQRKLNLDLF